LKREPKSTINLFRAIICHSVVNCNPTQSAKIVEWESSLYNFPNHSTFCTNSIIEIGQIFLYYFSRTKGYSKKTKRFAHLWAFEREKKATAKNQKKRKKSYQWRNEEETNQPPRNRAKRKKGKISQSKTLRTSKENPRSM
jgi:hypothetical protein